MSYSVEIHGLKELEGKIGRAPEIVRDELVGAMGKSVLLVERGAKVKAPVNIGQLRSSISGQVKQPLGDEVIGVIGSELEYAPAMEKGATPHFPPMRPLAYWAQRKLGVDPGSARKLAFLIARKIARYGLRARPYLEPALDEAQAGIVRLFEAAGRNIAKRLG